MSEFCAALNELRLASKVELATLARLLGISRAQLYVIVNGEIKRPPDWDKIVRPFVAACAGGDERTLGQWRRRHAVLVDVFEELRRRDRAASQRKPASAAVPLALAQLPATVAGFTGRADELAVLARFLHPAQAADTVVVSAVGGLAGVGKTALAVEAGHAAWQHGWYPGGIVFIDLHGYDDQPVPPGQALDAVLRALDVPAERIPAGTEERAGLYRSVLAQVRKPVLIVADNSSSEAQVRPLLPGAGPHKVLVTSRHTMAGLAARLIDLTVLDEPAAITLLDTALLDARSDDRRISGDRSSARRLAAACGGLPLALQIVASILKADPAQSAGELADELGSEQERLERLAYDDGSGTVTPSVLTAFGLSYRMLAPASARLFRLLAVNPGPDVSTAAAVALAGLPVATVRRLLAGLARAHLAEPGPAGRWRMHDLLGLYAQRLSDEHGDVDGQEAARDRLLSYYLDMAAAADVHLRGAPGTALPPEFSGQAAALAWLDAERPSLIGATALAAVTGRDEVAQVLPLRLAVYFDWRNRHDDIVATAAISLAAARRAGNRENESRALNCIGCAFQGLRRFEEAITADQGAAAIFREIGDRHGQAMALTNLGNALQGLRRFEEAITAYQDAGTIYRETGDVLGEGMAANNFGFALMESRRFEEASAAFRDAAAIFRENRNRHHESVALTNLGVVLKEAGRFEEAISAYQDGAEIFRETGDRHREGIALDNLGAVLTEVGRFEEAISAYQDAVEIFRETGDRHREGIALDSLRAIRTARS